ncbi:MAG: hypothetical protein ACKVOX_07765 [Rhizobacter sp.]
MNTRNHQPARITASGRQRAGLHMVLTGLLSACGGGGIPAPDIDTSGIETVRRADAQSSRETPAPYLAAQHATSRLDTETPSATPSLPASTSSAVTGPMVTSVSPALERRIGDHLFDCGYTLRVQNGALALNGLTAELVSAGESASVVNGQVEFVDLAPGERSPETGLLLLRQKSGCTFDKGTARWNFTVHDTGSRRGGLLTGAPGLSAISVLRDSAEQEGPARVSTSTTASSPKRARLYALVGTAATVGQVNAALIELGARIVAMAPANRLLTLELADPGSALGLQDASTRLMASRAFEGVAATPLTSVASLPDVEPLDDHRPN